MDLERKKNTIKEVKRVTVDLNPKKAAGYYLITGKVLERLPEKPIISLLCF